VSKKYFRRIDGRNVYGTVIKDREGNPKLIYVRKHVETHKEDWVKVRGEASPYDGNLLYWAKRLAQHPLVNNEKAKLLKIQQWQCPKCGLYFKEGDLLEVDHRVPTALGGGDAISNKWVFHRHCHEEKTAEDMARLAKAKAAVSSTIDRTLRSQDAGKPARPVLDWRWGRRLPHRPYAPMPLATDCVL
jgi:RNA-directed DNA polymerase